MIALERTRRAGLACLTGALVWIVAITIEYRFGLQPPGHGTLLYLDQALFFVAQMGFVAGIIGLIGAGAAGRSRLGVGALGLFALGWIVLLVAIPLVLITGNPNLPLLPLGGLCAGVGGLLAGIAVAVAGRWQGWQRWSVLCYGLYYVLVLFVPAIVTQQGPRMGAEVLWGLAWLPLASALITRSGDTGKVAAA